MTISVKHKFQSAKADSADASLIRPSNWNDEHAITMASSRLLGRATAGAGVAEEIAIGAGLALNAGALALQLTKLLVTTALGFTPANIAGDVFTGPVTLPDGTKLSSATPRLDFIDTTASEAHARFLVNASKLNFQSSPDAVTWTTRLQLDLVTGDLYAGAVKIFDMASGFVPIAAGGTGGKTQATARTGLGLGDLAIKNLVDFMSSSSSASNTNLPVTTYVLANVNTVRKRGATTNVYLSVDGDHLYACDTGRGDLLDGTWRCRGSLSSSVQMFQRTS